MKTENYTLHDNLHFFETQKVIETLEIESKIVKNKTFRNICVLPQNFKGDLNLVFVLAGFTGNGPNYAAPKKFDLNFVQNLENWEDKNKNLNTLFVLVDAWNEWGGSQFINSEALGNFEDYIIKELYPAVLKSYPIHKKSERHALMGGSSGGYGALHLGSKYPDKFGTVIAIAPDSFFDSSLLPEIYTALPLIEKMGGLKAIQKEITEGRFFRRRESHTIINVAAMGLCYTGSKSLNINWPIDKNGSVNKSIWKKWLKHDPVYFLKARKLKLQKLSHIFLEVGKFDQFNLQYGARQINQIFKSLKVKHHYEEFNGNHFDLKTRHPNAWAWLAKKWKV